jgi:hypothetical protein
MLRPEGLTGPLVLIGVGRDLRTDSVGTGEVVGEASMRAVVDYTHGQSLLELQTDPVSDVEPLIGKRAGSGFRSALNETYSADRENRSLLFSLLDDIPVTTLISGHVMGAEREASQDYWQLRGQQQVEALRKADLCAGWREGGTIMVQLRGEGFSPTVTGPVAPALDRDDPLGWHSMAELAPSSMRRRRRLDVRQHDGRLIVDAMFRDSYVNPDGVETIIHEYTIDASVDPATSQIQHITSDARVLPWRECPVAAGSAGRLAGARVDELRSQVRESLSGISTCTHLNDALRGIEDVTALWTVLDG